MMISSKSCSMMRRLLNTSIVYWVIKILARLLLNARNARLPAGKIKNVNYTIDDMEIESRFISGRVNELKISLESDENDDIEIILKGNSIRSIIRRTNGGILRSTMIEIEMDDDDIVFNGKGNGHGVGLCQWGTLSLSHEGTDFKEILSHYFRGTEIKPISYDK